MIETTLGQNKQLPTIKGADEIQVTAYTVSGNLTTNCEVLPPAELGQKLTLLAPGACMWQFGNLVVPQVPNEEGLNVVLFAGPGFAHLVAAVVASGYGSDVLGWSLVGGAGYELSFV